jgi:phage replication-related protein YjqB (UPF0714/DUF867 family)
MPDKYPNFATLEERERSGIDYCVLVRRAEPAFAIVAPHGAGIEPGTSEIAAGPLVDAARAGALRMPAKQHIDVIVP